MTYNLAKFPLKELQEVRCYLEMAIAVSILVAIHEMEIQSLFAKT